MSKNDNGKTFSLPNVKILEPYCDLMKKKEISEIEIETDQIRVRLVSSNLNTPPQKQVLNLVNHEDAASVKTNVIEKRAKIGEDIFFSRMQVFLPLLAR